MRRLVRVSAGVLAVLLLLGAWPAWQLYDEIRKARSENPAVWADDIDLLVSKTRGQENAVVFIGSSSIRLWSTLERDMAPLPVVQHGFGGAKLRDVLHYTERLVNAYRPRAVVVFAGSNDLSPGDTKPPEVLLATYRDFVARVRADLPDVPIFFIGITPSPLRWEIWPLAVETNRLIRAFSETRPDLFYVETGPGLLGANGQPDGDHYRIDGLHLSASGYEIWTRILRTRLLEELER